MDAGRIRNSNSLKSNFHGENNITCSSTFIPTSYLASVSNSKLNYGSDTHIISFSQKAFICTEKNAWPNMVSDSPTHNVASKKSKIKSGKRMVINPFYFLSKTNNSANKYEKKSSQYVSSEPTNIYSNTREHENISVDHRSVSEQLKVSDKTNRLIKTAKQRHGKSTHSGLKSTVSKSESVRVSSEHRAPHFHSERIVTMTGISQKKLHQRGLTEINKNLMDSNVEKASHKKKKHDMSRESFMFWLDLFSPDGISIEHANSDGPSHIESDEEEDIQSPDLSLSPPPPVSDSVTVPSSSLQKAGHTKKKRHDMSREPILSWLDSFGSDWNSNEDTGGPNHIASDEEEGIPSHHFSLSSCPPVNDSVIVPSSSLQQEPQSAEASGTSQNYKKQCTGRSKNKLSQAKGNVNKLNCQGRYPAAGVEIHEETSAPVCERQDLLTGLQVPVGSLSTRNCEQPCTAEYEPLSTVGVNMPIMATMQGSDSRQEDEQDESTIQFDQHQQPSMATMQGSDFRQEGEQDESTIQLDQHQQPSMATMQGSDSRQEGEQDERTIQLNQHQQMVREVPAALNATDYISQCDAAGATCGVGLMTDDEKWNTNANVNSLSQASQQYTSVMVEDTFSSHSQDIQSLEINDIPRGVNSNISNEQLAQSGAIESKFLEGLVNEISTTVSGYLSDTSTICRVWSPLRGYIQGSSPESSDECTTRRRKHLIDKDIPVILDSDKDLSQERNCSLNNELLSGSGSETYVEGLETDEEEPVVIKRKPVSVEEELMTIKREPESDEEELMTIKREPESDEEELGSIREELVTIKRESESVEEELESLGEELMTIKREPESEEEELMTIEREPESEEEELESISEELMTIEREPEIDEEDSETIGKESDSINRKSESIEEESDTIREESKADKEKMKTDKKELKTIQEELETNEDEQEMDSTHEERSTEPVIVDSDSEPETSRLAVESCVSMKKTELAFSRPVKTRTPARKQRGSFYSTTEKRNIVAYIIEQKGYRQLTGKRFWEDMVTAEVCPGRTWQSLKEHFIKHIFPYIHRYVEYTTANIFHQGMRSSKRSKEMLGHSPNFYTEKENKILVHTLLKKRRYRLVGGISVWKRLENLNVLPGRSWQSMRDHYRKVLVNKLQGMNVSQAEAKALLTYCPGYSEYQ